MGISKTGCSASITKTDLDMAYKQGFADCAKILDEYKKELQAFKDKQEQGLLIELPVPLDATVWTWEYPTKIDENGDEWVVCDRRKAKVVPRKFSLIMLDKFGQWYFLTKEEALAKMGGSHEDTD